MNASLYHLIIFICCIVSLTLIVITGHDTSPLVNHIVGGLFGGVIGGAGVGAVPALANFFAGPPSPPPARMTGKIQPTFLIALLFVASLAAACASLQHAVHNDPIATACASSSVAVKTLTTAKQAGALSASDTLAVNRALDVVTPICSNPNEPEPSAAVVVALSSAVESLQKTALHYSHQ